MAVTDKSSAQHIQEAQDWLSVSHHASSRAEYRFRNLFSKVAQRGIDGARSEDPDQAGLLVLRDVYFQPTDEERQALRDAYLEWQAFKIIWTEKETAYHFSKETGKAYSGAEQADRRVEEARQRLFLFYARPLFYALVSVASLLVIARVVF